VIDDAEPELVRDQVEEKQNAHRNQRSDQLDVDRASDVYLHSGRFSVEQMISFLAGSLSRAADSDSPLLRAAGEMSWVLPQPEGTHDFFVYEAAINKIIKNKPAVFMCMYDLRRCGVSMLVDVLKTHPKVLLDGMVLSNPDYLSPTEKSSLSKTPQPRPNTHWPACPKRVRTGVPQTRGDHSPTLSCALLSWWPED
jgi:hypothetical protein